MTQLGLMESVLEDLHCLHDFNTKDTPALCILHPDHQNHPHKQSWNYRSLTGKLNCLAQNACPDISFDVHQCAQLSSNLTGLEKFAMKQLGCYLLSTKDRDLSLTLWHDVCLYMYVEADFLGLWHHDFS